MAGKGDATVWEKLLLAVTGRYGIIVINEGLQNPEPAGTARNASASPGEKPGRG